MEIRLAGREDIPELMRLLYQVGDVHHQIRPDIFRSGAIKYEAQDLEELLQDEKRPVFAAMEGDLMLGYCFCQWNCYQGSTVLADRTELYIDDLCIDAESRGTGVAQALFRHAKDYAAAQGCQFVSLNVWCGNDRAMRFYEKMGMKPRSITMDLSLEEPEC